MMVLFSVRPPFRVNVTTDVITPTAKTAGIAELRRNSAVSAIIYESIPRLWVGEVIFISAPPSDG